MWRHGCPVSPERFSSCSTSVACCGGEYEHSNERRAIQVVGQDWSSEVAVLFLEDWELGRVALSCHMAVDLLRQEMILSCVGWPVSLEICCSLNMVCHWNECVPSFLLCRHVVNISRRLKGGRALPFVSVMATVGRMVFLTFDVCTWEERADLRLVCLFLWFFQSQTFQHW